jgi:hypothetical protein
VREPGEWLVGKLRTGSEERMSGRLGDIGVEAYCPMERQKGPRRRGEPGREAIERPALPGYLPIREATLASPDAWEWLDRDGDFYDFIRDVNNDLARMLDLDLNPLRSMEKHSEPVRFISGPVFYLGERVKVPYNSPHVAKAWWGMIGQVVNKRNGRYCLGGHDFKMEAWFSGRQLMNSAV